MSFCVGEGSVLLLLSIVLEQLLSPSMVHVVVPGTIWSLTIDVMSPSAWNAPCTRMDRCMLFTTGKGDKVWGVIGRFKSHMLSVVGLGLWSHSTGTCHIHSILFLY